MINFITNSLVIWLTLSLSPYQMHAQTPLDVYLSDFYSKSNEASKILKEIEFDLKEGSRKNVCSRQREAVRLILLANKSLIKAFEDQGADPPMEAMQILVKKGGNLF